MVFEDQAQDDDNNTIRTHPLTLANRFTTSPSTIQLPRDALVEPIKTLLASRGSAHIPEAAHRVFGGFGLPYSISTPNAAKVMQAKPVAIDAYQHHMSEIEGDLFMAVLAPGLYATVMSVLVETRKRLGTAWAEKLVDKANQGDLHILDAGAGGAGIVAVRELLRAEWERMHEDRDSAEPATALAQADGRVGGCWTVGGCACWYKS